MVLFYVSYVCTYVWAAVKGLAREQALRGALAAGREKEGELATTSLEFIMNIYIKKVDADCLLAEMALVMTSLLLARVFQCLLHWRWLAEIWQLSRPGAKGEMEVESNSSDVVASSPSSSRPAARASRKACS